MRVLVVDDDASVRELVRAALDDHDVRMAADGQSALDEIEAAAPDVVLLDVMMPGMDGFEVLAHIRRQPATKDLPVVMLTAKVSEADHIRAFRTGADAYITKPFDVDELEATVRSVSAMPAAARASARKEELDKAELLRQIEQRFTG